MDLDTLTGVVLGIIGTLAATQLQMRSNARAQQATWQRDDFDRLLDTRRLAYVQFIGDVRRLQKATRLDRSNMRGWQDALEEGVAEVQVSYDIIQMCARSKQVEDGAWALLKAASRQAGAALKVPSERDVYSDAEYQVELDAVKEAMDSFLDVAKADLGMGPTVASSVSRSRPRPWARVAGVFGRIRWHPSHLAGGDGAGAGGDGGRGA